MGCWALNLTLKELSMLFLLQINVYIRLFKYTNTTPVAYIYVHRSKVFVPGYWGFFLIKVFLFCLFEIWVGILSLLGHQ